MPDDNADRRVLMTGIALNLQSASVVIFATATRYWCIAQNVPLDRPIPIIEPNDTELIVFEKV